MIIERYKHNPILYPNKNKSWEGVATFNGCPIKKDKNIFLVYRAISFPHYHETVHSIQPSMSEIGIAKSTDGIHFYQEKKLITPEKDWEKFGCEDPRITKFNNRYFIFYTALSSWPPQAQNITVGLAISNDLKTISEKHHITPFNAKAMSLFPEKINGKIWAILTINTDKPPANICIVPFDKETDLWSKDFWNKWYQEYNKYILPLPHSNQDHIESGTPPIKTKYGWLLFYAYIKNYFSSQKLFSIQAVLLDLKNPKNIIGKTDYPILIPEEYYEKYGLTPNTIFPSGAIIHKNKIYLYYGAADTTCSLVKINAPLFLKKFITKKISLQFLKRAKENPIIQPIASNSWESKLTFNPGAIFLNNKVHIIYRAMSQDNTSVFGYANSLDGIHINYRHPQPVYVPREPFEQKLIPNVNSGVEDPRLIKIKNKIYMFYTAYDGKNPPRVALTSIKVSDFLNYQWNKWSKPILISPPNIDDKDAMMFPEKINNKYVIIHRTGTDIDLSFHSSLNFKPNQFLEEYRWIMPRQGWWDSLKVGAAAPPIKTKRGWILFYHGVSEDDHVYRVGAVLISLKNPLDIIARTDYPVFEPEKNYEKIGEVPNVVFPCSAVLIKDKIFVYYGAADKVCGVATITLKEMLKMFEYCKI
ncbi:MAG: hypothetical protein ACP5IC_01870 [Minisyncoccia bacterium]